jgi:hypothetical protein
MPITPEDLERFRRMKADAPAPPNPSAYGSRDFDSNEPDEAERAAIEARTIEAREVKEREATNGGPVIRPGYDRTRPNGRHLIDDPIAGSEVMPSGDRTCPECGGPLAAKKNRCYRCKPAWRGEPREKPMTPAPTVNGEHVPARKTTPAPMPVPVHAGSRPGVSSFSTILDAFHVVADALEPLRPEDRRRVLDMVTILAAESEV